MSKNFNGSRVVGFSPDVFKDPDVRVGKAVVNSFKRVFAG
jgi:hypothetical protein